MDHESFGAATPARDRLARSGRFSEARCVQAPARDRGSEGIGLVAAAAPSAKVPSDEISFAPRGLVHQRNDVELVARNGMVIGI